MTALEKPKDPVAIVGIGCRLPGNVNHVDDFWKLLKEGVNAISDVPENRWSLEKYYDPDNSKAGKVKNKKGGFVNGIDQFDADFFKIFPAEASRMDPQQRMLLEVSYQAMEDAGIRLDQMSGSLTSVFMGVFMNDYWDMQTSVLQQKHITPHVPMGVSLTSIANRLSYVYNLKGPSVTLDTACSSSLVGIHLACKSIWSGESTMALAGGVNAILRPESSIMMSKGNFLSPDGQCKTFDSRANGYVRSEGCGVVLLKPLAQAEADGDRIYATIHGSAVNQDGHTEDGFTVPSVSSQTAMLETAYRDAGIDPKEVSYVEAHGTGTPVGDPIETNAFGNVIGKNRSEDEKCWIGSVKTNIGHLESAAGVAGLIKLALILKNKQIPQNLHFENPNPKIPFDQYRLKVPTQLTELPKGETIVAGVNSFGAGGTNAHVVMKSYEGRSEQRSTSKENSEKLELFTLSARSEDALKQNTENYIDFVSQSTALLSEICANQALRRSQHDYRLSVVCRNKEELKQHLQAFLDGETRPGMISQKVKPQFEAKVGFIFSGQGPQWYAMGQQLLKNNQVFSEVVHRIDQIFSKLSGWSLLEEMQKDEASSRVSETQIAQPAIMAVQIGLAEVLKSQGVLPQGCVGHSIGEVAAAYTSGSLTLEQAVEVIYHRSRGQNRASGKGKMLAAGLKVDAALALLRGVENRVSIAAINGPEMLTLSGDEEPLQKIAEKLDQQDIFHRFLKVNVPFHSHHMEPLKDELIASLQHLETTTAKIPLYSTVSGKKEDGTHLSSVYWYMNVREPVYFTDAVSTMLEDGYNTFVEIAPHPVLSNGVNDLIASKNISHAVVVPTLRRKEEEALSIGTALAHLYAYGYGMDWKKVFSAKCTHIQLPAYAWQHKSYWFESKEHSAHRLSASVHPHLAGQEQWAGNERQFIWKLDLSPKVHPYVEDHKVDGTVIFPGTGHLEVAYAAAQASFGDKFGFLEDIHFESALFLPEEDQSMDIRLEVSSDEGSYAIFSKAEEEGAGWTMHSRGLMNYLEDKFESRTVDLKAIQQRLQDTVSVSNLYLELKEGGLQYGEAFRCIQKLYRGENEILAAVKLSKSQQHGIEQFGFHPALLDASLHAIFAAKESNEGERRGIYLPVHIQRFKLHTKPDTKIWSYIEVSEASHQYLRGDFYVLNEDGSLVAEIQGLSCKYIEGSRGEAREGVYEGMYQYDWNELSPEEENQNITRVNGDSTGGCVIFVDHQGVADALLKLFKKDNLSPITIKKGAQYSYLENNHYAVNPASEDDIIKAFEDIESRGFRIDRIMYLWGLDSQFKADLGKEQLVEQQKLLAESTLGALKAITKHGLEPLVYFVSQAADDVVDGEPINFNQAALYGMGRVMMNEYPFVRMSLIDLDQQLSLSALQSLYQSFTIVEKKQFPEVALRGDKTFVHKLQAVSEEKAEEKAQTSVPALASRYQAIVKEYGTLDGIVFRQTDQQALKDQEVEIEVKAAGLNFKDIMNVMGLLSDEAVEGGVAGKALGLECAGVVKRVGKQVKDIKIGDEVMAWSANSFAGYTITNASCVVQKPKHMSFEEAATLTVVYLTAHYSLNYLARLSEEDTVLIHAASGGVGIAAIHLAQQAGARIIATAGTEEKRKFVSTMGVEHVFDSRSLSFADEVRAVTNGKGVDVILNSLSGKGLTQSIKCLAPFGTFIEIGKADIYKDTKLALKRFGDNLSFHAVDLDRLMLQKPRLGKKLFQEVVDLIVEQEIPAHPLQVFSISQLSDALRTLSKGTHVGKLAVSMQADDTVKVLPNTSLKLDANATYIVTGGASGFGLVLAKWLSEKGAKNLVLLSRSGGKQQSDFDLVEQMQQEGVEVHSIKLDITDEQAIQQLLMRIRTEMPPLKGIIHSAAVLDDATLPNTDMQRFQRVFTPKVMGAWNLHQASKNDNLDFFLMLSSISSLFGLPGQSNYSSANNFLDKLAKFRQSQGLAASSVNLGVLGMYAGMSKEGGNVLNVLANQGWLPLSLSQVTEKIENILLQKPAVRMAANLDWKNFRGFFTHLQNDVRFAHFMQEANQGGGRGGQSGLMDQVLLATEDSQVPMLKGMVAEALSKILGTSTDQIETELSISAMGLDSLMLNQLRNWIHQKLEINFPLMKIAKGPSITELATQLLEEAKNTTEDEAHEQVETSGIASEDDIEVIADKWMIRNKKLKEDVQQRIFCFHPVGAGASMFSHFVYHPPKGSEVLAFQLPGRENRADEAHYEDIAKLIPELAQVILPYLDKPFIVMGHSFGGIVGFELIRYLRMQHALSPQHLFITGTIAPQLTRKWKERDVISQTAVETNSEERLLSLMNYIDDVDFLKRILPVMRKDMPLIMSYLYQEEERLSFPITAFAAAQDEVVLVEEVSQWKEQTQAEFTLEVVDGDHWFLSRNRELILQRLEEAAIPTIKV